MRIRNLRNTLDRISRAGFLLVGATLAGCENNRGGNVPRIRAALELMPGVRVQDVVGWDSMWPLFGPINIRADLELQRGGHLVLCDLTPEAFTGTRQFILARVGRWAPYAVAEREMGRVRMVAGCPESVDIGPDSAFLKLVPFKLRSVAEVVNNYDRLEALIEAWPTSRTRITASDGSGWVEYHKIELESETH